jgi:hypothetical protein
VAIEDTTVLVLVLTVAMSSFLYPTSLRPLGTPRISKNLLISSWRTLPRSSSLTLASSPARSPMKIAAASRWRWGDDGAVKLNTAGAVSDTATP